MQGIASKEKNGDRKETRHGGKKATLAAGGRRLTGQDEGDDEAVQGEGLGENEDEDHDDEEFGLLRGGADARVTNDADTDACGETGEADREAGREVGETEVVGVVDFGDVTDEDNRDDEAVDTWDRWGQVE